MHVFLYYLLLIQGEPERAPNTRVTKQIHCTYICMYLCLPPPLSLSKQTVLNKIIATILPSGSRELPPKWRDSCSKSALPTLNLLRIHLCIERQRERQRLCLSVFRSTLEFLMLTVDDRNHFYISIMHVHVIRILPTLRSYIVIVTNPAI